MTKLTDLDSQERIDLTENMRREVNDLCEKMNNYLQEIMKIDQELVEYTDEIGDLMYEASQEGDEDTRYELNEILDTAQNALLR